MFSYQRTHTTRHGEYAYRASDGRWYVINDCTGEYTGDSFDSRRHAVAAMQIFG